MIIDGRAIAADILTKTKARAERLPVPPSFLALTVDPSPATSSYLRMKRRQADHAGIRMEVEECENTCTKDALLELLNGATQDALIVQLPLPFHIDTHAILDAIPSEKDADVLSRYTRASLLHDVELMHPIAGAIQAILKRARVSPKGKRAVVVGQGWLVGKPAAEWLRSQGAEVTVVTLDDGDLETACQSADILVSGVGSPGLITPELIRPGSTVIDIGTSEVGGSLLGDVDPAAADIAAFYTPVPGGVGPITVACLLANVVTLAERRQLHSRKKAVH